MRFQHRAVLLALHGLAFAACSKDEPEEAPVVTIISPQDGYTLGIPDTLWITADVSGDPVVDRVMFSLVDANGVPVTETMSLTPSSNPAHMIVGLPVLTEHAVSGTYKLTVRAFHGEAQGSDYRSIHVNATALRLRAIYAFTSSGPGSIGLHRIDSAGTLTQVNDFVSDFAGAAISSYGQTLAMIGSVNGPLTALSPDGSQVKWQQPNQSVGGMPWFTCIDATEENVIHVGTSNGLFRGYNATTGGTGVIVHLTNGFSAQRSLVVDGKVVIAEKNLAGNQLKLLVGQAGSGALVAEQFLDKEVVGMYERDAANVLLFGNRNGQGVVEDRSISGGGGWEPYTWPSPITAVVRANDGAYLVALENGDVERFNYSNATSLTVLSGDVIGSMSNDPANGPVYAARGNEVLALDPSSGAVLGSWSMGQPVVKVLVLLNK